MNLIETLEQIAKDFDFPSEHLIRYASEDFDIGGYHPDASQSKWEIGSIWEVEGRILYALVRYLRPSHAAELGSFRGCSTHHIIAALERNMKDGDEGKLTCVDKGFLFTPIKTDVDVTYITGDAVEWMDNDMPKNKVDFLFEDLFHETEQVRDVWSRYLAKGKRSGVIVSHDVAHFVVGQKVALGILSAGVTDAQVYLTEPSDCGLAVWQLPAPKTASTRGK